MLKHKDCGTQIYLDYTSDLKLLSRPVLTYEGLIPSYVEIVGQMSSYNFFCPKCGKVSLDSLSETCCCGISLGLENLWMDKSESGLIWCDSCANEERLKNPLVRVINLKTILGNYRR